MSGRGEGGCGDEWVLTRGRWGGFYLEKCFSPYGGKVLKNKVNFKKTPQIISIKGWAYDAQKRSLPNAFHVIIDDQISAKVNHKFYRPDAAEYLGLEKNDYMKILLVAGVRHQSDRLLPDGAVILII